MKKVCVVCGEEFEAKRNTAQYCSPTCRKRASRVTVTNEKPLSVTNPLSVTVSVPKTLSVPAKKIPAKVKESVKSIEKGKLPKKDINRGAMFGDHDPHRIGRERMEG